MYTIDGLFLTQRITGIQRYAYELCLEIDKLITPNEIELLVPANIEAEFETNIPQYNNIKVIRYGKHGGIKWQQIDLARYLKKNKREGIFLTNILPLMCPRGIMTIHDVSYKANPDFFTSKRDRVSALWHRLNYWWAAKSKIQILTDSEFSKEEIKKYYHIKESRIHIVYVGWQHMQRINASTDTFDKYSMLKENEYYFAMSTLAPNKNFKWIMEAAKQNPNQIFAIAGGGALKENEEAQQIKNLHLLGYVSDEDAKTLMKNCKAFLFPTLYEGFGMPPLEAIVCGAKHIIVSDTPCMREVYGDHATYISPKEYTHIDLSKLDCLDNVHNYKPLLDKYSWKVSAKKIISLVIDRQD